MWTERSIKTALRSSGEVLRPPGGVGRDPPVFRCVRGRRGGPRAEKRPGLGRGVMCGTAEGGKRPLCGSGAALRAGSGGTPGTGEGPVSLGPAGGTAGAVTCRVTPRANRPQPRLPVGAVRQGVGQRAVAGLHPPFQSRRAGAQRVLMFVNFTVLMTLINHTHLRIRICPCCGSAPLRPGFRRLSRPPEPNRPWAAVEQFSRRFLQHIMERLLVQYWVRQHLLQLPVLLFRDPDSGTLIPGPQPEHLG